MKTSSILLGLLAVAGIGGIAYAATAPTKVKVTGPGTPVPPGTPPTVGPGTIPGVYPPGTGNVLDVCKGVSTLRDPLRSQVQAAIAQGLSPTQRELLAESLDPVCPAAAAEVRGGGTSASAPSTPVGPISLFSPTPKPTFNPNAPIGTGGGIASPFSPIPTTPAPTPDVTYTPAQQTLVDKARFVARTYDDLAAQGPIVPAYLAYVLSSLGYADDTAEVRAHQVDALRQEIQASGIGLGPINDAFCKLPLASRALDPAHVDRYVPCATPIFSSTGP